MQPSSRPPARSWRSAMIRPDYTGQAPPNKGKTYPVEVLTRTELTALVGACSKRSASGIRNAALMMVYGRAALRVSEGLALLPKDVDVEAGAITILRGKGAKRRVAGCPADAVAYIQLWLNKRAELGLNGRHPLFCTIARDVRGGALNDAYVREMVKERAAKAGIEKRCHPHGLRHTAAVHMMQDGCSLTEIQYQLGHADSGTTDIYLNHVAGRDVVAAQRRRPALVSAKPAGDPQGPTLAQLLDVLREPGALDQLQTLLGHELVPA